VASLDEQKLAKAIADLISAASNSGTGTRKAGGKASPAKKKRGPNAYNKEFSKQMKSLKKKHPRTPVTKLMKRAHTATKKARKGKR